MKNFYSKFLLLSVSLFLSGYFTYPSESNHIKLEETDTREKILAKASLVVPTTRQLAWQHREFTAFVHFGMNTFTNKEWGDGTENPEIFNPKNLDTEQWIKVIKDAGMSQIILTAKHHDGFCLWPSKYTEHSVRRSLWKNGKGDVVHDLAAATRKAGIALGIYYSPWDRHEKTYGTPEYNEYMKNQLSELLTNYGEISEVWLDGACGATDSRCKNMPYDWDDIFALIRKLQPNAVISISGPDVRWIGNEAGVGETTQWSVQPADIFAAAKRGEILRWYPAQADTSIRPGWFYHKNEDYMVKSLSHLLKIYFETVGNNSQLLLNIPPNPEGLISKYDIKRLSELRYSLDLIFNNNLANSNSLTNSNNDPTIKNTLDGSTSSYWEPQKFTPNSIVSVEYDFSTPRTFDIIMLQEHIASGQRIESFTLDIWDNNKWKPTATGTTIGYKKILRLSSPQTTSQIRLNITQTRSTPRIAELGLYLSKKQQKKGDNQKEKN